jgi:hypothetical protein
VVLEFLHHLEEKLGFPELVVGRWCLHKWSPSTTAMATYNACQTFGKTDVPETDAATAGKIGKARAAIQPQKN